jgi:hypothetical protein
VRTTVDIPDPIYRRLKSRAAEEGSSTKKLILRGVEQVLRDKPSKSGRKRVKLPIIRSKRPGTIQLDNARIYDIISFP